MRKQQITKKTIQTIRKLIKTKKKTYRETALILTRSGVKTPMKNKPTISFVNYVLNTYC